MLTQIRLPVVRQDTAAAVFAPISGARASLAVIESAAIVEMELLATYTHDAGPVGPIGTADQASVQAQLVTPIAMVDTDTWEDVPFNQTDESTDTSVIEHSGVDADRILIKQTGLYEFAYTVGNDPSGSSVYAFRLRVNDTTVLPGSLTDHSTSSQHTELTVHLLATLTAGDFVTFQYSSGGASGASLEHVTFTASRQSGSQVAKTGGEIHLTFEINGVDVAAPYTDGLLSHTADTEGQRIALRHRQILEPGDYVVQAVWKTNSPGTVVGASLRADTWPADFNVEVRSNIGTLAHGVGAKPQGVY